VLAQGGRCRQLDTSAASLARSGVGLVSELGLERPSLTPSLTPFLTLTLALTLTLPRPLVELVPPTGEEQTVELQVHQRN
jgi:hypothetical protein